MVLLLGPSSPGLRLVVKRASVLDFDCTGPLRVAEISTGRASIVVEFQGKKRLKVLDFAANMLDVLVPAVLGAVLRRRG